VKWIFRIGYALCSDDGTPKVETVAVWRFMFNCWRIS